MCLLTRALCTLPMNLDADLIAPSPQPNGFPSPPLVSFPIRDERFAFRGPPMGAREKISQVMRFMGSKREGFIRRILSPTATIQKRTEDNRDNGG
jgi:hypothetical protein